MRGPHARRPGSPMNLAGANHVTLSNTLQLPQPYLLFLGDVTVRGFAKTALGLADWVPELCVGECALPSASVTTGLARLSPAEGRARGARSLVIGVANRGGVLSPAWIPTLVEALEAGLDLVSGMHGRLAQHGDLKTAADRLKR